jgi:hypothetical protein
MRYRKDMNQAEAESVSGDLHMEGCGMLYYGGGVLCIALYLSTTSSSISTTGTYFL